MLQEVDCVTHVVKQNSHFSDYITFVIASQVHSLWNTSLIILTIQKTLEDCWLSVNKIRYAGFVSSINKTQQWYWSRLDIASRIWHRIPSAWSPSALPPSHCSSTSSPTFSPGPAVVETCSWHQCQKHQTNTRPTSLLQVEKIINYDKWI